jgi:hypothetical protein
MPKGCTGRWFLEIESTGGMVQLIKSEKLRRSMGKRARETVKKKFLLIRYLEQYLDLFRSFETIYRFKGLPKEEVRPGKRRFADLGNEGAQEVRESRFSEKKKGG